MNNISVSVYGAEQENKDGKIGGFFYPLKVVKEMKEKHVDMLLYSNDENNHYCWIKNFSRLVGSQYTKNHLEHAYCRFCLHGYVGKAIDGQRTRLEDAKRRRDEHEQECFAHNGQKLVFPDDDSVGFDNVFKQVEAPFRVYADFESILLPINDEIPEDERKKTTKYQEHIPCAFAYHIVSSIPGLEFKPRLYFGEDAPEKLLDELKNVYEEKIRPFIETDVEMVFDKEAEEKYDAATDCYICEKALNEDRVRDHCHFTGKFRGAAHSNCNLQYQISKKNYKLPIVFHNLRGYDAHLIMQGVRKKHGAIRIIPMNMERYISFSVGPLTFLDSMQFLNSSLEKLASALKPKQFVHLMKHLDDVGSSTLKVNRKRKVCTKSKQLSKKKPRNQFIEEECEAPSNSDDDDETSYSDDEKFIDDDRNVNTDSASFYRRLQNSSSVQLNGNIEAEADNVFDEVKFKLLRRKGVYPYDYFNCLEKFNETQLPTAEHFYNKLCQTDISEQEYEHAEHVWDSFKCKTLRDYHDVYLLSDVLLLTDVFEHF